MKNKYQNITAPESAKFKLHLTVSKHTDFLIRDAADRWDCTIAQVIERCVAKHASEKQMVEEDRRILDHINVKIDHLIERAHLDHLI